MTPSNDWQRFFEGHAPRYREQLYTKDTVTEVDFLVNVLDLEPGHHILDLACGTGRHAVELAKRGHRVTGVDISAGMLAEVQRAAEIASVAVEWLQADVTSLPLRTPSMRPSAFAKGHSRSTRGKRIGDARCDHPAKPARRLEAGRAARLECAERPGDDPRSILRRMSMKAGSTR